MERPGDNEVISNTIILTMVRFALCRFGNRRQATFLCYRLHVHRTQLLQFNIASISLALTAETNAESGSQRSFQLNTQRVWKIIASLENILEN